MNDEHGNKWTNEKSEQVEYYLDVADRVIVDRRRTIKLVCDLFAYNFPNPKGLKLLDLGCGDGVISRYIHSLYPDNEFHLVDGSRKMIARAEELFAAGNASFTCRTFEEILGDTVAEPRYDFVYSAHAIHHLDLDGKRNLYKRIHADLRTGGLFLNMDAVQPATQKTEEWQLRMWKDWMNENLRAKGLSDKVGEYDGIPDGYRNSPEDMPSSLKDQLQVLEEVGFQNVDCFYKYSIFAVFGGTK